MNKLVHHSYVVYGGNLGVWNPLRKLLYCIVFSYRHQARKRSLYKSNETFEFVRNWHTFFQPTCGRISLVLKMNIGQPKHRCILLNSKMSKLTLYAQFKIESRSVLQETNILVRQSSGGLQELRPSMIQFNVPVLVVILASNKVGIWLNNRSSLYSRNIDLNLRFNDISLLWGQKEQKTKLNSLPELFEWRDILNPWTRSEFCGGSEILNSLVCCCGGSEILNPLTSSMGEPH